MLVLCMLVRLRDSSLCLVVLRLVVSLVGVLVGIWCLIRFMVVLMSMLVGLLLLLCLMWLLFGFGVLCVMLVSCRVWWLV